MSELAFVPDDPHLWSQPALSAIQQSSANTVLSQQSMLRVLSHALPTPTIPGHAYPQILEALKTGIPRSQVLWINLMHAVPSSTFTLDQIPTSPPTTPGPAIGGQDYFTSTVFDSTVSALNYGQPSSIANHTSVGIVPPGSIDMSIVERYIPPPHENEFLDLFTQQGPSLLGDRLRELAPNGGCLSFIYPTKRGGQMFADDFLAPVLDPVLRQLTVLNDFTAEFSHLLGGMRSAKHLFDYETLEHRTNILCHEMSKREQAAPSSVCPHNTTDSTHLPSTFRLIHASPQIVHIERSVLASWWLKQEKTRIRKTIMEYVNKKTMLLRSERRHVANINSKLPTQEIQGGNVIHLLMEEFAACTKYAPEHVQMEIAVLVIKREISTTTH